MPVSQAFVDETCGVLAGARPIRWRKMFGGVGIYCQEVFFAVIDDDRLYFKVDDQTEPDYLALGMDQWVIPGAEGGQPYREVPPAVFGDSVQLGEWIDRSVAAAERRKSKTKKPKG